MSFFNYFRCGFRKFGVGRAYAGHVVRYLSGERLRTFKLFDGADIVYEFDGDVFAVEILREPFKIHFHYKGVFAERGTGPAICHALIDCAVYFRLYAVDAGSDEHLVCGINYIGGGETEFLAPSVPFAHFAADEVLPAEELFRLLYLALFYVLFDERGRDLFAVYRDVLDGHVPHAVFFIFGKIF